MNNVQFVRDAQANVVPVAHTAIEAAKQRCAQEVDVINRMMDDIQDAVEAIERKDMAAYQRAMSDLAANALAQCAMARVPGCQLLG